jgi:hypothetical protein
MQQILTALSHLAAGKTEQHLPSSDRLAAEDARIWTNQPKTERRNPDYAFATPVRI